MADISKSMPLILQNEGGYVNDPADPGGATNFGITLATLSDWRGRRCTPDDVRNMSVVEAEAIYKAHYWSPLGLDGVKAQGVATSIFDCATNRGVGVARQYMIETCSRLGVPDVNQCDPHEFVIAFEHRCEQGYLLIAQQHPRMRKFLRGWLLRARRLLGLA